MTARTKQITIGDRTLAIGMLPLGPIRQNPEAFAKLGQLGETKKFDLPTAALVVFSSIDQEQTPISVEDFYNLIDRLDYVTGMKGLTTAFVIAMEGTTPDEGTRSGEEVAESGSSLRPDSATSTG